MYRTVPIFVRTLTTSATIYGPVNRVIMLLLKESAAGLLSYDAQLSCALRLMMGVRKNRGVSHSKTVTP